MGEAHSLHMVTALRMTHIDPPMDVVQVMRIRTKKTKAVTLRAAMRSIVAVASTNPDMTTSGTQKANHLPAAVKVTQVTQSESNK